MKRFSVFLISFITLFLVFQILSGLILTAFYTPNLTANANDLNREISFGSASNPFLLALLTATVAYFLSQKIVRVSKTQTN